MTPETRTSRAALGYATAILQYGAQIGLQVVLAPLVLRRAGAETLGIYAVLIQATAYLAVLDTSVGTALLRFLAQAHGDDENPGRFRDVISNGRLLSIGTGILFAFAAAVFALFLGRVITLNSHLLWIAQICMLILAGWALLRSPWSIYNHALIATQRIAASNLVATLQGVLRLIFTLGLVAVGLGLFGLVSGGVLAEAIAVVLCALLFHRYFPKLSPQWRFNRVLVTDLSKFALQAALMSVATKLIVGSDNIVVGYLLGPAAVAAYYTTVMPGTIGYLMVIRLADSAAPAINELWSRGATQIIRNNIMKVHRYTLLLVFGMAGGLVLFNHSLITLWVGPERYAGLLATASLACFAITVTSSHVNLVLVMATGKIRTLSILLACEGVLNLGLSILFGHYLGVGGVMLGSAVSNLLSTTYLQLRLSSELEITQGQFVRACVLPVLPPVLAACAAAFILGHWLGLTSWWTLGFAATIYTLTGVAFAWTVTIHAEDKVRALEMAGASTARIRAHFGK